MCVRTLVLFLCAAACGVSQINETEQGILLQKAAKPEEAAKLLHRAIELWSNVPASGDQIARATLWLVEAERTLGHFSAVEPLLRAALSRPVTVAVFEAELRNRLGVILRETGRYDDAKTEFFAVLATPGIRIDQQVEAMLGVANVDRKSMRFRESIGKLHEALNIAVDSHSGLLESWVLQDLGLTYLSQGDLTRAEPVLIRSLALVEHGEDFTPHRVATALQTLAALHAKSEKFSLAEDELLRALALLRQSLREPHPQIAAALGDLADIYRCENRYAEALELADRASSAMLASFGPGSTGVAEMAALRQRIEARMSARVHNE